MFLFGRHVLRRLLLRLNIASEKYACQSYHPLRENGKFVTHPVDSECDSGSVP